MSWGYEDLEIGLRLFQKGFLVVNEPSIIAEHYTKPEYAFYRFNVKVYKTYRMLSSLFFFTYAHGSYFRTLCLTLRFLFPRVKSILMKTFKLGDTQASDKGECTFILFVSANWTDTGINTMLFTKN